MLAKEDKQILMNVVLHASDVSNPAKSLSYALRWSEMVIREFFDQGEAEKEADIPVSMFMDRETTNIAKCQLGFINVIVTPLFGALGEFLPGVQPCITNLGNNKAFWDNNIQVMEIEMLSGRQEFPVEKSGSNEAPAK